MDATLAARSWDSEGIYTRREKVAHQSVRWLQRGFGAFSSYFLCLQFVGNIEIGNLIRVKVHPSAQMNELRLFYKAIAILGRLKYMLFFIIWNLQYCLRCQYQFLAERTLFTETNLDLPWGQYFTINTKSRMHTLLYYCLLFFCVLLFVLMLK